MTTIEHTQSTGKVESYKAEHEGYVYTVTFTNRQQSLAVIFIGEATLKPLFEVVAYVYLASDPTTNAHFGEGGVFCEDSHVDAAEDIMRAMRRKIRGDD